MWISRKREGKKSRKSRVFTAGSGLPKKAWKNPYSKIRGGMNKWLVLKVRYFSRRLSDYGA